MTWLLRALLLAVLPGAHAFPEHYGADAGGTRYAPHSQITPANVSDLSVAWTYSSGDLARRTERTMRRSKFQVTPILADGKLVLCTPFNEVIALDPGTGAQRWRFDPKIRTDYRPANLFNCRGVAFWRDPEAKPRAVCAARIFSATNDARVLALDVNSGKPCPGFGLDGQVQVDPGMPLLGPGLGRPGGRFEAGAALAVLALVVIAWALARLRSSVRKRRRADNAAPTGGTDD